MCASQSTILSSRCKKAAEILKVSEKQVSDALSEAGIEQSEDGAKLLEASTTTEAVLAEEVLNSLGPKLKRSAAAAVLKGRDPFSQAEGPATESGSSGSTKTWTMDGSKEVLQSLVPVSQWKDRQVLEAFNKDREEHLERELDRRAKGQRFIVLETPEDDDIDRGNEPIDIELSLQLLKKTRRMKIPTIIPGNDQKIRPVYRISELNVDERVVELCPICGDILFRGYCEPCQISWQDVSDNARAFTALIVREGKINAHSFSDKKALVGNAVNGVSQLRKVWPSIDVKYRELKASDNLPRLKMVKNLPAEQVQDPFHTAGNRSY